jgi:hypothetical protein
MISHFKIKRIAIRISGCVLAASFFIAFICYDAREAKQEKIFLGGEYSAGDADDPQARAEWERQMLMDPATGEIPRGIHERELEFASTIGQAGNADFSRATLAWTNRGPWNVGGMTRALAMDINDENILIAGTNAGSLWRSIDGGTSWTELTPKNVYHGITCIAQDKRNGHSNIWYYGTGDPWCSATGSSSSSYYAGTGMYKSLDSGMTWQQLASTAALNPLTFDNIWDVIYRIVPDASNTIQDVVYAATYGSIQRSADGGTTWTVVRGSSSNAPYFTNVELTTTGIVYATLSSDGLHAGIWRSVDGINYTNILPPSFPPIYNRIVSAINPSNENEVYFIANSDTFGIANTNFFGNNEYHMLWKYTYLSGDGSGAGGMWQDLTQNLPHTGGTFDKFFSQNSYDLLIKIKPNDPNTIIIGGTNLYRSTNGFTDTTGTLFMGGYEKGCEYPNIRSYQNHHPDQHEFLFLPSNPDVVYSGNDGGIFRTGNLMDTLIAWTPLDSGYLTTMFYTVAIDHGNSNNNIIIGGTQDNGTWYTRSTNPVAPWTHPGGGDGSHCYIADNESAFYTSIQNGKVYRALLDTTGAVTSFARIDPLGGSGYLFINPFTIDPNNNNIMYLAGGSSLWRNNDLSTIPMVNNYDSITTNWYNYPDTIPLAGGVKITALAVSKIPANRLYIGTNKGKVYRLNNATTDTVFVNITSTTTGAIFPGAGFVSCIAVDPTDADRIIVVFSNYQVYSLFYSANGGTSWKKIGGNLEQNFTGSGNGPSCRWAEIMPVTNGYVYLVGTSTGLYATNLLDSINTVWWQQGANEIGKIVVPMIDVRSSDGLVVAGTHANGTFSSNILDANDVVGIGEKNNSPKVSVKVFPNPASGELRIENPEFGIREVEIYDVNGQKIDQQEIDGSQFLITVDISEFKQGLYFVVAKNEKGRKSTARFVVAR